MTYKQGFIYYNTFAEVRTWAPTATPVGSENHSFGSSSNAVGFAFFFFSS